MSIERNRISTLYGAAIKIRPLRDKEILEGGTALINHIAIACANTDKLIATVSRDDIFDASGNRFYFDC